MNTSTTQAEKVIMKTEFEAHKALAKRRRELLAERKPLDFKAKAAKLGDKKDSKTWSII